MSNKTLYKVRGNLLLTKLHSIPDTDHFVFAEDPEQYILTSDKKIAVYTVADRSLVKSFPIESDLYRPTIDPARHLLGGFTRWRQFYRIYSLKDGRLLKEIKITFDETNFDKTRFFFGKDFLFFSEKDHWASLIKIKW